MGTILLILLVLFLVGSFPRYGYNKNWGYGPSGIVSVLLVVLLIMLFIDIIPWGFAPTRTVIVR